MNTKQARAEAVVATILKMEARYGTVLPLPKWPGRLVRMEDWEVKIIPGHRWSIARGYQERIETRLIVDRAWQTMELRLKGRKIFVVNLQGERVDIHLFLPGAWEKRFGSDADNDVVPHLPGNEPIGPNAEAQIQLRNRDLTLPAKQQGPPSGEELRNPSMRRNRSRSAFRPTDGPYTVALSQQIVPD